MDKKIYTILLIIFIFFWIIGIIIGYKKGAKKNIQYADNSKVYSFKTKPKLKIMDAKPHLFSVEQFISEPKNYQYKSKIANKFSIIDEKGNKLEDDSNSKVDKVFSYNILDSDIKSEEDLKKSILFDKGSESKNKTEFYKGFVEKEDNDEIKNSKYEVYTNF